jgi:hypothetical protein
MGTVIGLRGASTGGSESGLASIDVPLSGNIVGVTWAARTSFDTTADFHEWELSFGSVNSTTNDSRQIISAVSLGTVVLVTSGIYNGVANLHDIIPEIAVGMGERIYLHSFASAATVGVVWCFLHCDFDLDKVAVRRR